MNHLLKYFFVIGLITVVYSVTSYQTVVSIYAPFKFFLEKLSHDKKFVCSLKHDHLLLIGITIDF